MVATRFDYHYSPFGQKAGIALFPVSGVVSGAKVSLTGAGFTGGNVTVTVAAGEIKFDGVSITIASPLAVTVASGVANLATTDAVVGIYINPTRLIPAHTTAPVVGASGAMYLDVVQLDDYQMVNRIMKSNGVSWVEIDTFSEIPISQSHNMLPLNDIVASVSASNVSITPEIPIFHKSGLPPHVSAPSNAMMRQTAGFQLAEVTYEGGVATITKGLPDYNILSL
jgi:hypothetical protein